MYNSSINAGEALLACQDFDYENHERRTNACSEPLAERDVPPGARGPLCCCHSSPSSQIPESRPSPPASDLSTDGQLNAGQAHWFKASSR